MTSPEQSEQREQYEKPEQREQPEQPLSSSAFALVSASSCDE